MRTPRVRPAAVKLILEPIFEADFEDCSDGFRPGRLAHDALRTLQAHLKAGRTAVDDADRADDFDRIPHDQLSAGVRMRVVDRSVLGLMKQWLRAPGVEPSRDRKPPTVRRNDRGTPQGGMLSPFLLLDYAAPYSFPPGNEKRGVGAHPYKGFETVTVAYQGDLAIFSRAGTGLALKASTDAKLLVMGGEPIAEPVVGTARS